MMNITFPNVDGMKRILDEAQALSNEIQEIYKKLLETKSPEEAAALEHRLHAMIKRIEDFRKQYWGDVGSDEPILVSSEPPVP